MLFNLVDDGPHQFGTGLGRASSDSSIYRLQTGHGLLSLNGTHCQADQQYRKRRTESLREFMIHVLILSVLPKNQSGKIRPLPVRTSMFFVCTARSAKAAHRDNGEQEVILGPRPEWVYLN